MSVTEQLMQLLSERYDEYSLHMYAFRSPEPALAFLQSMSFTTGQGEDVNIPPNILATLVRDPDNPAAGPASLVIGGMLSVEQNYEVLKRAKSQKLKTVVNTAVGDEAARRLIFASTRLRARHPELYRKKWWQVWK